MAHAPIREALIDLRVAPEINATAELLAVKQRLRGAFPTATELTQVRHQFKVGSPQAALHDVRQVGFALHSEDKKRIVQARANGFAYSQLKPYDSWQVLLDGARAAWGDYVELASPTSVIRWSLRYINRIELPHRNFPGFAKYLRTFLTLGPGIPEAVSGLFMRFVIPQETGSAAVVTIAIDEVGTTNDVIPVILDIDVSGEGKLDPHDAAIWQRLGEHREVKNTIFYGSLTPEALELFS